MRLIRSHEMVRRPQRCAVVPYLGPVSGHRFIDTGQDMDDWHRVYISEPAFQQMAELFGTHVPKSALRAVTAELEGARAEIDQLRAELEEARHKLEAVDVLQSAGFVARKKPGRPKNEVAA